MKYFLNDIINWSKLSSKVYLQDIFEERWWDFILQEETDPILLGMFSSIDEIEKHVWRQHHREILS